MLKRFTIPALALSVFLLAGQAHAQFVSYNLDADNDLALYVGNADATQFRLVVDKTTSWREAVAGGFTLAVNEEYFYMLSLNYGDIGDIGGFLNGVSIVDMPNWVSKDVTNRITGFPTTEDPTFTPNTAEVRQLVAEGGFVPGTPTIGTGASSQVLGTSVFITPSGQTATLYRQSVTAVATAAAPEPGSIALLLTAGVPIAGLVRRRRKH